MTPTEAQVVRAAAAIAQARELELDRLERLILEHRAQAQACDVAALSSDELESIGAPTIVEPAP